MKRCPKCSTDYFDNMLDFCLDDGERLLLLKQTNEDLYAAHPTRAETVTLKNNFNSPILSSPDTNTEIQNDWQGELQETPVGIKQKLTAQWLKTLEIVPVIFALAHNYWQWLYLARKPFYDFASFFFSFDFLVWLILLITGAALGIISLKFSKSRGFAVTALVVLAINVILSIVPK